MTNGVETMTINEPPRTLARIIGVTLLGVFCILLIGIMAGYSVTALKNGSSLFEARSLLINGAALLLFAGSGWGVYNLAKPIISRRPGAKPLTQTRTGRLTIFWAILIFTSVATGIALAASGILNGAAEITPALAIGATVICIALFWLVDRTYRANVDELELSAGLEASYWALAAYLIGMPLGWLFWKAGMVEEMPTWSIYVGVVAVANVIFLWKRFR